MRYQRFLDVSSSPDVETFRSRLIDFAADLGFGLMSATVVSGTEHRTFRTIHNAPPAFAEQVTLEGADAKRDPALQNTKRLRTPFVYDQSLYVNSGAGDLWEIQAQYGYKYGIAVSLFMPSGKKFLLGFDTVDPLPEQDEALTRLLADLQLLAVHAQDAAGRLLEPAAQVADMPTLTPRELEILKWTAAGKTAAEVATILCISTHTVTFYMRSILEKFNAPNKHRAVLTAIALGVIGR